MQLYIRLTGKSSNSNSNSNDSANVKFSTNLDGHSLTCGALKAHLSGPAHDCGAIETLRLVFKGRILADDQALLEELGIREGATVFLVVSNSNKKDNEKTTSTLPSTSSTTGAAAAASPSVVSAPAATAVTASAASASASALPFPNSSRSNINNNSNSNPYGITMPSNRNSNNSNNNNNNGNIPEDPMQMLNTNPLFQNMLQNNPDFLTGLLQQQLQSNPALQRLMEQNPILREVLNDPAELRRLLQMQSNPDVRQQQQRLADLALQRAETLPGGFNALRQMYETMQVPLEESMLPNPDATAASTTTTTSRNNNGTAGAAGQAMPNPWGSSSSSSINQNNNTNNNNSNVSNPFASTRVPTTGANSNINNNNNIADLIPSMFAGSQPSTGNNNNNSNNNNTNNMFSPLGFPGNLSPGSMDAAAAALENPQFQQFMEQMVAQNPELLRQAMPPQFQNLSNEQLQQMMRSSLQSSTLRNVRQNLGTGRNNSNNSSRGLDFSNLLAGPTNHNSNSSTPANAWNDSNSNPWASPTVPVPTTAAYSPPPPAAATSYPLQMQQLRNMGFDQDAANREALQWAHGNLNRAVEALLFGGGLSNNNNNSSSSSSHQESTSSATAAAAEEDDPNSNNRSNNNNEQPHPHDDQKKSNDKDDHDAANS